MDKQVQVKQEEKEGEREGEGKWYKVGYKWMTWCTEG